MSCMIIENNRFVKPEAVYLFGNSFPQNFARSMEMEKKKKNLHQGNHFNLMNAMVSFHI